MNQESQCFANFKLLIEMSLREKARAEEEDDDEPNNKSRRKKTNDMDLQLDALFEITTETALLQEIKDIRDELNIISMVLAEQESVSRALLNEIRDSTGEDQ